MNLAGVWVVIVSYFGQLHLEATTESDPRPGYWIDNFDLKPRVGQFSLQVTTNTYQRRVYLPGISYDVSADLFWA